MIILERNCLIKTITSSTIISNKERKLAVKDLHALISRDCETLYRLGEEPNNSRYLVKSYIKEIKE